MYWHVGELCVTFAVDDNCWANAILQFADLGNKSLAVAHNRSWPELCVYDTDMAIRHLGKVLSVMGRRHMQGEMLLSDQACANPSPQVLIQEFRHIGRVYVFAAFQESLRKCGNGIRVCLHQVCHHISELLFLLRSRDPLLVPWQESGKGVQVVVVDLRNMRVRDHDEGQIPETLYAVC